MILRHWIPRIMCVSALTILATACVSDQLTAPPTAASASRGAPAIRQITLDHEEQIYASWGAYILAFNAAQLARHTNPHEAGDHEGLNAAPGASCGILDASALQQPTSGDGHGTASIDPHRLGSIHVWAPALPINPFASWIHEAHYTIPRRFLSFCEGTRYGVQSSNSHVAVSADDGVIEEEDNPPAYAPPGMTDDEYGLLNPAEKVLVWKKYWELYSKYAGNLGLVGAAFGEWLAAMDFLRTGASSWAAEQEPNLGGHNDLRDALRHAYWQCTMTVVFSEHEAMRWGDAHEKYSTALAEVRMDKHNNAKGRQAGRMVRAQLFPGCAAAVLSLKGVDGGLQEGLRPEPSMTNAPSGRPTPPPLAH